MCMKVSMEAGPSGPLGTRVLDDCGPPNLDAERQTWVFCMVRGG